MVTFSIEETKAAVLLSPKEIERYRPYHITREFWLGFFDGMHNIWNQHGYDGVEGYDRGLECAMRRRRQSYLDSIPNDAA